MRSIALFLSLCSVAHADPSPAPGTPPALAVPDATLRAVKGQLVIVCLQNGASLRARVVAFEASTLTFALELSGTVVSVDRAEVTEVRLFPRAESFSTVAGAAPSPRERHLGLQFSGAPGLMVDVDYGLFYGFANFPVVYAAATGGGIVGFSVGAGVNLPVARRSRWKLELFGFVSPLRYGIDNDEDYPAEASKWSVGVGLGIGVHYTFSSGFSLGLKSPIIGYATGGAGLSAGLTAFYLSSAIGLPVLSLGYRF